MNYDKAFYLSGYPEHCLEDDGLIFSWGVTLSGICVIPYADRPRFVSVISNSLFPYEDGRYPDVASRGYKMLISNLGEMAVFDMLMKEGLVMGEDFESLNPFFNVDSPKKSWDVAIPDIMINEDLDTYYLEVKTTSTNKLKHLNQEQLINEKSWSHFNNGIFKCLFVEIKKMRKPKNFDYAFMLKRIIVIPDNYFKWGTINTIFERGGKIFCPKTKMKNEEEYYNIADSFGVY